MKMNHRHRIALKIDHRRGLQKKYFFTRFKLFFLWSWLLSSCKDFCKVPAALLKFSPCLSVRGHFIRSIVRILKLMPCFAVESRGILAKPCLSFVFQLLRWLSILWMICSILVLLGQSCISKLCTKTPNCINWWSWSWSQQDLNGTPDNVVEAQNIIKVHSWSWRKRVKTE